MRLHQLIHPPLDMQLAQDVESELDVLAGLEWGSIRLDDIDHEAACVAHDGPLAGFTAEAVMKELFHSSMGGSIDVTPTEDMGGQCPWG